MFDNPRKRLELHGLPEERARALSTRTRGRRLVHWPDRGAESDLLRDRSSLVAQRLPIFLLQTVDGLVANSAHRRAATDITRYRSAGGAICPLIRVIRWFGDFSGTLGWSVYDNAVSRASSEGGEHEYCTQAAHMLLAFRETVG